MVALEKSNIGLVAVLWLAGLVAAAQFGKISVLYGELSEIYPQHGIGLMVSIVGIVGLIFGTTAGLIVQQLGYRRILVAALVFGALLSFWEAVFPPYPLMMALRILEGFSHLAIVVAAPVLIARVTARRHFGTAMSLWSSFFGVSFALTAWGGTWLSGNYGPWSVFVVHGAAMLVIAAVLARMIPVNPGAVDVAQQFNMADVWAQHRRIYASATIAAPGLGFVFYTAMYVAILTLLPTLFIGADRIFAATAMPLTSIFISLTLGVWLLMFMPAFRVVQIGFLMGVFAGLAIWLAWGSSAALPASLLLATAMGLVQGASFASIPQLNDTDKDRAHAAGAVAQLGNLGTTSGTPILAALILGYGINGVLVFVLPLAIGGLVVTQWLASQRRA